jgi:hypothetical protein
MISHHETLEEGPAKHRCQVVRWVRSFPFSFLSDREYIIGRRVWRAEDGCLYGVPQDFYPTAFVKCATDLLLYLDKMSNGLHTCFPMLVMNTMR